MADAGRRRERVLMTFRPKRRWLQFRLRGMLILVTAAAVFFSWAAVQQKWIQDRRKAKEWVQRQESWNIAAAASKARIPWNLRLFGDHFCVAFIEVHQEHIRDNDTYTVDELRRLFPEAAIKVAGRHGRITDP